VFFLLFFVANLVTDISISVAATVTSWVAAAAGRGGAFRCRWSRARGGDFVLLLLLLLLLLQHEFACS